MILEEPNYKDRLFDVITLGSHSFKFATDDVDKKIENVAEELRDVTWSMISGDLTPNFDLKYINLEQTQCVKFVDNVQMLRKWAKICVLEFLFVEISASEDEDDKYYSVKYRFPTKYSDVNVFDVSDDDYLALITELVDVLNTFGQDIEIEERSRASYVFDCTKRFGKFLDW